MGTRGLDFFFFELSTFSFFGCKVDTLCSNLLVCRRVWAGPPCMAGQHKPVQQGRLVGRRCVWLLQQQGHACVHAVLHAWATLLMYLRGSVGNGVAAAADSALSCY